MPDKNFKKSCGKSCIRCWENKLNHANKRKGINHKKRYVGHQNKDEFDSNQMDTKTNAI
jgi:hypothetical protein